MNKFPFIYITKTLHMEQPASSNLFDLSIDQQASGYLRETAKWAKFLAVLGFIACGLFFLVAVISWITGTSMTTFRSFSSDETQRVSGAFSIILMLICTLIYFLPYLYLFNFASKMQVALRNNDQQMLEQSFRNLKSCFKYVGILTIIVIAFFVVIFLGGILFAVRGV